MEGIGDINVTMYWIWGGGVSGCLHCSCFWGCTRRFGACLGWMGEGDVLSLIHSYSLRFTNLRLGAHCWWWCCGAVVCGGVPRNEALSIQAGACVGVVVVIATSPVPNWTQRLRN